MTDAFAVRKRITVQRVVMVSGNKQQLSPQEMGERFGYLVARHLREKPEFKDVLLCALTGYTPSEADHQRQQENGFNHYYVKPLEINTLLELFRTVVASHA